MRDAEPRFREKGATVAAVGLGGASYARHFRDESGITFPLLIDEDHKVHDAARLRKANFLDLLRPQNFAARKRAKAAGHNQHKLGKDPLQLGGSFVFGPGNVDLFVHISQTFSDNASMEDLLGAITPKA